MGALAGSVRWAAWAAVAAAAVSRSDLAVVGASVLLILLARGEGGAFVRALRSPALQWLGKVSYSLYLVHVPVALALAHALGGGGVPAPVLAALTVVVAALSQRRSRKRPVPVGAWASYGDAHRRPQQAGPGGWRAAGRSA